MFKRVRGSFWVVLGLLSSPTLFGAPKRRHPVPSEAPHKFSLSSWSFRDGTRMSKFHSCEYRKTSEYKDMPPSLAWDGVPFGTKSYALIMEDPDYPDPKSPETIWVHWILYNIPRHVTSFVEGYPHLEMPPGVLDGLNSWNQTGYRGPCPPRGRHRYFFRLYALDKVLPDLKHPTRLALLEAMSGHILGEAVLMGLYERGGIQW